MAHHTLHTHLCQLEGWLLALMRTVVLEQAFPNTATHLCQSLKGTRARTLPILLAVPALGKETAAPRAAPSQEVTRTVREALPTLSVLCLRMQGQVCATGRPWQNRHAPTG